MLPTLPSSPSRFARSLLASVVVAVAACSVACGSAPDDAEATSESSSEIASALRVAAPSTPVIRSLTYLDRRGRPAPILTYAPAAAGTYPVFVLLTGTNGHHDGPAEVRMLETMVAKGVVSISVSYDDGFLDGFDCTSLDAKVRAIFGTHLTSALSVVARSIPAAAESKGIAVAGFSQGSWLAHMGATARPSVRAAWLLASGMDMDYGVHLPLECNAAAKNRKIPIRAFSGEHDTVYVKPANPALLAPQLAAVTGIPARADDPFRGFDADGDSGWTLVRDEEVTDGEADHGYFYVGGLGAAQSPDAIDPIWDTGDVLWGRTENLRWLASKLAP